MALIRMAGDTDAAGCMNLRLLMNEKSGKILYAEAGKDFVDLLFSFLTLPTGSVIKLLSHLKCRNRVGSITNLYNSVDKLQSMFMSADKSHLLEPSVMCTDPNDILRIKSAPIVYYVCGSQRGGSTHYNMDDGPFSSGKTLYKATQSTHYMATQSGGRCACGQPLGYEVQLQNPVPGPAVPSRGGGYVKETVTFIITNELEISPASTITSINLLNKLNVRDLSDLGERNVNVGRNEALELLHACLVSTTALDDVFGDAASPSSPRRDEPEEASNVSD